jgi:CRISPR-associated endonuclease/helicase Cas3
MVCDLVSWERMVQRLGRVNRRGSGDAEIEVFWSEPSVKAPEAPTETERRALIAFASRTVIEKLPFRDEAFDASPSALRHLAESARTDAALRTLIEKATTSEPLRPALNRALVDAWSMTSLETHTGRPDVAPWLRGWVEEERQTTVVWRKYLPVRVDDRGRCTVLPTEKEIEDFFEAAAPHESEKLETETYRVADWLEKQAEWLISRKPGPVKGSEQQDEEPASEVSTSGEFPEDADVEEATVQTRPPSANLQPKEIVALCLSSSGDYTGHYRLADLTRERNSKAKEEFQDKLVGKTIVLDARFGGLEDGLLNESSGDLFETADDAEQWREQVRFRVERIARRPDGKWRTDGQREGWRFEDDFDLCRDGEGSPVERLIVQHLQDTAQKQDSRSISKLQELSEHQTWAQREMERIAKALGLPEPAVHALVIGAGLHDEGKKAEPWQRAFNAPSVKDEHGAFRVFAKTGGPINQAILGGYRHEFGSLPFVEADEDFKALPEEWRDRVRHLIAAHHGQARPVIERRGCEDGPPSALEERARAVALRFARLQRRWGPWGLAWWEALMRAADQQASRRLEED